VPGVLEEGKRKRRGKVIKVDEGNATDRVFRKGHDDEKRLSGLRNSTKEKRATTLLQPGTRLGLPASHAGAVAHTRRSICRIPRDTVERSEEQAPPVHSGPLARGRHLAGRVPRDHIESSEQL
jgi:hypothetical protein